MLDPMKKFRLWKEIANENSPLSKKNAVCVSTIDADGYPVGRFVDLKDHDDTGFIFCTVLNSPKGKQISANPKVSITVWWDHVGYQIRILGTATQISSELAAEYWSTRSRDAKLTTLCSDQSVAQSNQTELADRLADLNLYFDNKEIPKPKTWGGYKVIPQSVEFLEFQDNRLHIRELYKKRFGEWESCFLQP